MSASRGTGRRWEGMNKAEARGSFLLPDFTSWMPAKRGLGKMLLLGLSISVVQGKKKIEGREGMDQRAKRPRISP